ncbi:MAG TPA: CsbD family protein [Acetobacteraceae bacterium]|nr:CsbD family protein [Acetobacteraceae bacterium]
MDENRVEGAARDLGGKAKEGIGRLTGDAKLRAEGKFDQMAGQAQRAYGQAADQIGDTVGTVSERIREQPLTALLIAIGVGYLAGRLS